MDAAVDDRGAKPHLEGGGGRGVGRVGRVGGVGRLWAAVVLGSRGKRL